jgi:predicted permease
MLSSLVSDLRVGLRFYRRNPGFALLAVAVLAVGIGSTTALFSVFDAVLLKPLPFREPSRLVAVWESAPHAGLPRNTPAPANFLDWQREATSFEDLAASNQTAASVTGGEGRPESLLGRRVTENLFELLGTPAALGRTLVPADRNDAANVVLISDGLWRRRFGAAPDAIGQTLRLDGTPYTVVGVMPRGFVYPSGRFEFWLPARWPPTQATNWSRILQVVGRLKPGVEVEAASAEMREIARRSAAQHAENAGSGAYVRPLAEDMAGAAHRTLPVLLAAAAILLLIACANVANLLLAKALGRSSEMSLRQALGASRWRLMRQTAVESLLLGLTAGGVGVAMAALLLGAVRRLVPQSLTGGVSVELDLRVLAMAVVLSFATACLFGLAPAAALSSDPWRRLGGGRGSVEGGRSAGRLRDLLVVAEVALALVLLVGAGLAIRSLDALTGHDIGFRTDRLLTMSTRLPRTAEPAQRLVFYDRVLEQVRALPGVEHAAYVSNLPFTARGNSTGFAIEGRPFREGEADDLLYRVGTADYLPTIGLQLLEGRFYDSTDVATSQPVVVINETLRRRFFDGNPLQTALGHRLEIGGVWRTIVGVVANSPETGFEASPRSGGYLPVVQNATAWAIPEYLAVRTSGDPMALAPAVRAAIWRVDPEQPIAQVRSMDEWMALDVADRRSQRALLAAFSGVALSLAVLGIYGVLAYTVSRRRREIGLRMALGATPRDILAMVGRSGFRLIGAGLAIGAVASLLLTRAMTATVYPIRPTDPVTYLAVTLLLVCAAAAAAALPARRASRVDPSTALRNE